MSVNIAYKFGVDKYCRLCKQQANESYDRKTLPQKSYDRNGELKNRWEMSVARTFGTRFMTYSDYEDAMNYLNLIGYNTKGDIHQQFCDRIKEKHGVVLEQTDIKHTDTDPYPFKSPYNEDNTKTKTHMLMLVSKNHPKNFLNVKQSLCVSLNGKIEINKKTCYYT
jgi:hypothetical protein